MAKEHPILFGGEMVRAILEGLKTQTRRVIKPQPKHIQMLSDGKIETSHDGGFDNDVQYIKCPYGKPGDRLWVRETWAVGKDFNNLKPSKLWKGDIESRLAVCYEADNDCIWNEYDHGKIRPSIFMPRWARRNTLEITGIRVERVQDISYVDSTKEGLIIPAALKHRSEFYPGGPYRAPFKTLWDSINAKRGYGWKENPWVWVVEFKVIHGQ